MNNDLYINAIYSSKIENTSNQGNTYEDIQRNTALEIEKLAQQYTKLTKLNLTRSIPWRKVVFLICVVTTVLVVAEAIALAFVLKMILSEELTRKFHDSDISTKRNISHIEGVTENLTSEIRKEHQITTQFEEQILELLENSSLDCGEPPNVEHSLYQSSGALSSAISVYSCFYGYVPLGTPMVFCQENGEWTATHFACVKDCGQPPTIPFAASSFDTTHSGSVARYKCQKGFDQLGNSTSVCQPNGKWSNNDLICQNTQIRLVGGKDHGRVEVNYFGVWGTICDDNWGDTNAIVVCKQLGFRSGTPRMQAEFGEGKGPIWMDDVNCTGLEAKLEHCPFNGWGQNSCNHSEDVGVVCVGT